MTDRRIQALAAEARRQAVEDPSNVEAFWDVQEIDGKARITLHGPYDAEALVRVICGAAEEDPEKVPAPHHGFLTDTFETGQRVVHHEWGEFVLNFTPYGAFMAHPNGAPATVRMSDMDLRRHLHRHLYRLSAPPKGSEQ